MDQMVQCFQTKQDIFRDFNFLFSNLLDRNCLKLLKLLFRRPAEILSAVDSVVEEAIAW